MSDVGMGRRPLLGMVLGWLTVVVAVAGITFVVVDRAGRGVGQASAAERLVVPVTAPPRPTATSKPTVTPTPTATVTGSPRPGTTSRPDPTSTPGESTPPPSEITARTESFATDGGTVVASCEGEEIFLDSIRPRDGWSFEKEIEHGGLEVVFKASEGEDEILLVCVQGVPTRGAS